MRNILHIFTEIPARSKMDEEFRRNLFMLLCFPLADDGKQTRLDFEGIMVCSLSRFCPLGWYIPLLIKSNACLHVPFQTHGFVCSFHFLIHLFSKSDLVFWLR